MYKYITIYPLAHVSGHLNCFNVLLLLIMFPLIAIAFWTLQLSSFSRVYSRSEIVGS